MNLNKLEVKILNRPEIQETEVWLIEEGLKDTTFYYYENDMLNGVTVEHALLPESAGAKPFLKLNRIFAGKLFQAIAQALHEMNVKTPDENLLTGKMQAMEKHLEDMRELTKGMFDRIVKTMNP